MSDPQSWPLTPFEELFLLRDHVDAPSSFFCRIELDRRLDPSLAQSALDKVCQIHPLASCRVERQSKRRPRWVFCPQPIVIDWRESEFVDSGYPKSWFDPTRQRPLRVTCYPRGESGTTMLFHVHHVAFDGLGFLQWFQDWLRIYRGEESTKLTYDPRALFRRGRPFVSTGTAIRVFPGQWRSVRSTWYVLRRNVIPLVPDSFGSKAEQSLPAKVVSRSLIPEATQRVRLFARKNSVSFNSVLAKNVYLALSRWQRENGIEPSGSHFRLAIPFNERLDFHRSMSACNHCTIISFDRSPEALTDPESLLAGIDREVRVIQRWKLSLNFWRALRLFHNLPGGLARYGSPESVTATTLFSNLGRMDRNLEMYSVTNPDSIAVTDVEVVPTLHRGMAIAIAVYEMSGQLRMTIQYDGKLLSENQANEYADIFFSLVNDDLCRSQLDSSE